MKINEEQAINYLSGLAITLREKINVYDENNMESEENNELYVSGDERLMCRCLELVLIKAKSNMFITNNEKEKKTK